MVEAPGFVLLAYVCPFTWPCLLFQDEITQILLKGKAHYSLPPCTNLLRSTAFDIAKLFNFLQKQDILMRRSTVLILPFQ